METQRSPATTSTMTANNSMTETIHTSMMWIGVRWSLVSWTDMAGCFTIAAAVVAPLCLLAFRQGLCTINVHQQQQQQQQQQQEEKHQRPSNRDIAEQIRAKQLAKKDAGLWSWIKALLGFALAVLGILAILLFAGLVRWESSRGGRMQEQLFNFDKSKGCVRDKAGKAWMVTGKLRNMTDKGLVDYAKHVGAQEKAQEQWEARMDKCVERELVTYLNLPGVRRLESSVIKEGEALREVVLSLREMNGEAARATFEQMVHVGVSVLSTHCDPGQPLAASGCQHHVRAVVNMAQVHFRDAMTRANATRNQAIRFHDLLNSTAHSIFERRGFIAELHDNATHNERLASKKQWHRWPVLSYWYSPPLEEASALLHRIEALQDFLIPHYFDPLNSLVNNATDLPDAIEALEKYMAFLHSLSSKTLSDSDLVSGTKFPSTVVEIACTRVLRAALEPPGYCWGFAD